MSVVALLPAWCLAERITVPLAIDHHFVETLLREQVFTADGGSVRLNDDGSGCQHLTLRDPQVAARGARLLLEVDAAARAGRAVGGRCLLVLDWRGRLELTQEPVVSDGGRAATLRTASWRILKPDGSTDTVSTTVGGWVERFLPEALRQTRIDLTEPLAELRGFLALMAAPERAAELQALLDSVAVDAVTVGEEGALVMLGMDTLAAVPESSPPAIAEPVLTAAELTRLEPQLDTVDDFFTYTIKSLSRDAEPDPAPLARVLMELRRSLVTILSEGRRGPADPARQLFVDAWEGLLPVLETVAEQQAEHAGAVRYLTFIGAGDALRALDAVGPAAGIEITSDGLRRLARILVPVDGGDPLQHGEAVDPELRRSLGFGEPLSPPEASGDTSWLDWLIPKAVAAEGLDPALVKRLNNWVPKNRDMDEYLPMVRDVLRHVVGEQLRSGEVTADFHQVYRWLVVTAAWQESCWRQFEAKNDMRVPVQSASGDVGMMQINPRVWRGLYDLQGLRWDIVYNARAGADILQHHLIHYAIGREEHQQTGSVDNLARATYAAYNGGPGQYDRYRRADASPHGRKVDALFYEKYQEVKRRGELAVTACYSG